MTKLTISKELYHRLSASASLMKTITGVANNCAINILYECFGAISGKACDTNGNRKKAHPRYRHEVKQAFKHAMKEISDYESALIHTEHNRFFHVNDLSPQYRKIYGDISDREYFEFWKGTAASAHASSRPLVTSLWNKYRLSMMGHGIVHADITAWGMVGVTCLQIAILLYDNAIDDAIKNLSPDVREVKVRELFAGFSLRRVLAAWKKAVNLMEPNMFYKLDPIEDRNIEHGIRQIAEPWINPDFIYDSLSEGVQDFDDVFRTKGEMKKALRNIAEIREEVYHNLENTN